MSYVSHTDHTSAPLPSFSAASSTTRPAGLAAGSIVAPSVVPVASTMEINSSTYTPPVATPISADSSNA